MNADSFVVKAGPALMKNILELFNYYKFAISRVSVKHKIFEKIQDPTFLIENIIERKNSTDMTRPRFSTELYLELYEVLEIYEFETFLDKVSTKISISALQFDHSSRDIYGHTLGVAENYPNSFAADVSINVNDFQLYHSKVGPTEELVVKS